jgi:uncharacterized DUF497 family protein
MYVHCQYTMCVRIQHELRGVAFEWDSDKADTNVQKHGVSFHAACEVFFDPFVTIVDTSNPTESARPPSVIPKANDFSL